MNGLVHLPDPELRRLALHEIERRREAGAAGALERLAQTAADGAIREQASVAARRLQTKEMRPRRATAAEVVEAWPRLESMLATAIDGDGGQALALVRVHASGLRLLVHVFHKDGWGIKDVFGFSQESEPSVGTSVASGFLEQGLATFEIELSVARGIIAHAVTRNAATAHPIPPAFEVWAPFFHDQFPPAPDAVTVPAELDDTPYAERADLVRESGRLVAHQWFAHWLFDVDELTAVLGLLPDWQLRKPTAAEYARVIARLVDPALRTRWRSRLRRQARLLDIVGDLHARDLALATAASFAGDDESLGRHPFLKAMVNTSLANLYPAFAWQLTEP